MTTYQGLYCLRTKVLDWNEQKLLQTYSALTDIESVYRRLTGELGLGPVFHGRVLEKCRNLKINDLLCQFTASYSGIL